MGKKWINMKATLSALLIVMLFVLAGCQSVGGLDVNKALLSTLDVHTYEGKSSFSIELIADEKSSSEMDPEEAIMMKLFRNAKMNLYNMKVQNQNTMSADGDFSVSETKIPFQLSITPQLMVMQMDGANKPIVLDLEEWREDQDIFMQAGVGMLEEFLGIQDLVAENSTDVAKAVVKFLVRNMPNPKNINASLVTETINGEYVALSKLHSEIYGSEVIGLIGQLLKNLSNDSEGLKQMIGQLYDMFIPVIEQMAKESAEQGAGEQGTVQPDMAALLGNKTLAVEYLYTTVQHELKNLATEFDSMMAEMMESGDKVGLDQIFNDKSYMKANLYLDSSLMMRKADMEMMIVPQIQDNFGLKAIKVTGSSELWNVNKTVTAKTIDPGRDYFELSQKTKPGKFLRIFDKNSAAYDLLYNQLHITQKHIMLYMDNNRGNYNKPFIANKTAMVPARLLSSELDSDVIWNAAKQQVTVIDDVTGKEIVFTIGSKQAYVNGEPYALSAAPLIIGGRSYVPLKFVIEHFGGTVSWDGDKKIISIDRE